MLAAIPPSSPSSMPAPSTAAAAPAAIPGGGAAGDYTPRRPSPLSSPPRPPMNLHHTSPLQFSFLPMSPPTSPPSRLDFGTPSSQQTHWRDRHRPQGMMRTPLASRRSQLNVGPSSATTTTKLPSSSLSSTDASREKRRDIFLKRVRREREDSRWHARGGEEEMMRSLYVLERRRWEEGQARASKLAQGSVDAELDLWMNDENTDPVPDFLERDLEELIARNMDEDGHASPSNYQFPVPSMYDHNSRLEQHLHSDDDLYDQLFREVLDFENAGRQVGGSSKDEEMMMDTSNG